MKPWLNGKEKVDVNEILNIKDKKIDPAGEIDNTSKVIVNKNKTSITENNSKNIDVNDTCKINKYGQSSIVTTGWLIWRLLFELSIILTLTFRMTLSMCQIFSKRFAVYEMVKFTLEENWEILKTFFQSGESSTETARKLRSKFGKNKAPSRQFVDSFVKRVRETGSLTDKTTHLRARSVRSVENIAAVAESVNDNPSTSTGHRAQEWDISRTSLQRILTKDLRHIRFSWFSSLGRMTIQCVFGSLGRR